MFILTILIHETGHFVFGLLTGYRLLHFEILGVSVEKINGRLRVRHYKKVPIGQCLMYPVKEDADPVLMILGGPVFNLLAAIIFGICTCFISHFIAKTIILCFVSLNLALGIFNLFMGSDTCDGKTYREIKNSRKTIAFYNCSMLIYRHLREGRSYIDMPDILFKSAKKHTGSSLEEEMHTHCFRYLYENGKTSWDSEAAGERFASYVLEHAESVKKQNKNRNAVFLKMVEDGKKEMYPGEWLSAARCMMEMTKGD